MTTAEIKAETIAASPLIGYTASASTNPLTEPAQVYPVAPTGWRILVGLPEKQDKVGGLYMPQDRRDINHRYVLAVKVLAMGDLCYKDKEKFPTGAWCKVGDWIQIGALNGDPFKMPGCGDREFRLINDDMVAAVVTGPDAVERI